MGPTVASGALAKRAAKVAAGDEQLHDSDAASLTPMARLPKLLSRVSLIPFAYMKLKIHLSIRIHLVLDPFKS
jgi:hypothetical protein